jgi:hypothetical protein
MLQPDRNLLYRQFRFQRGVFFCKSGAGGVHDAE